jgi:hypothetical protein
MVIRLERDKIPALVREIRSSYQIISTGFGKHACEIKLSEAWLLPLEERQPGVAAGFIETCM